MIKVISLKSRLNSLLFFLFLFTGANSQSYSIAIEKNLKSDLQKYFNALEEENAEDIKRYLYPDMFRNLQEQHPDEYSEALMEEILRGFTDLFSEAKRAGVKLHARTGTIEKIAEEEGKSIFLIQHLLDMERGNKKITSGSYVLGISLDQGRNFTFLAYDEELAPPVLQYNFSSTTIKRIRSTLTVRLKEL